MKISSATIRFWAISVSLALLGAATASPAGAQITSQVFKVDVQLSGLAGGGKILKLNVKTADIINIARNRPQGATVPSNEALGLTFFNTGGDSTPLMKLIVYDTTAHAALATIVSFDPHGVFAQNATKGTIVLAGQAEETGGSTAGITEGWVAFSGPATIDSTGLQLTGAKLNAAIAALRGVTTDNTGTVDFDAVFTKGKLTTLGVLGTLVEGQP